MCCRSLTVAPMRSSRFVTEPAARLPTLSRCETTKATLKFAPRIGISELQRKRMRCLWTPSDTGAFKESGRLRTADATPHAECSVGCPQPTGRDAFHRVRNSRRKRIGRGGTRPYAKENSLSVRSRRKLFSRSEIRRYRIQNKHPHSPGSRCSDIPSGTHRR